MLVLSRKKGERVLIGGGIEIVVIEVQGKRVRLGFNAPGEVPIHREEVWKRLSDVQPTQVTDVEKLTPQCALPILS